MDSEGLGCCAVQEMLNIGDSESPEQILKDLREILYTRWDDEDSRRKPSAFYVFTGVVKFDDDDTNENGTDYSENFWKFIKKYRLGPVTRSVARKNRVNEPGHTVRVYVWAPAERNLKRWWKQNLPEYSPRHRYW